MESYFVYILCSKKDGVLYIGITSDLIKRMYEHKNKLFKGFTKKYNVNKLIYFEEFNDINEAIKREKILKFCDRDWKIQLIEKYNKDWKEIYVF